MSKAFASQSDLTEKVTTFTELAEGVYSYTAEGDPNAGVIIADDSVMVIDPLATPVQAQKLIQEIRKVTDKPIKHLVLSHYHAVRVLGASAYQADNIIASQATFDLIQERGEQDFKSELQRFPRLFDQVETVPGLTWPTLVFDKKITLHLGRHQINIIQIGRGHTQGDTIVHLINDNIIFSGDLVEMGATPYCGDAYIQEWPQTLDKIKELKPKQLIPGRGDALTTTESSLKAIASTKSFLIDLTTHVQYAVSQKYSLKETYDYAYPKLQEKYGHWVIFDHCIPFNMSRAYDELSGIIHPTIWTEERDIQMWQDLQG
ncbi:MBL fold metallo-hydrolase [Piscirickettsia litoralis]|uniref:MBL fold metallo-hydrolase n=1 Tax=Piscirickettsia litoralis TaxID=1891921 RepID=A0ABX3AB76_9GAMM|nr:MBL fold metallo-hydrolase [Piscirickettsia litoralis]ODN43394.1 MBL fold metallo-hydrolase [Piscirickettsia litoralis]